MIWLMVHKKVKPEEQLQIKHQVIRHFKYLEIQNMVDIKEELFQRFIVFLIKIGYLKGIS